MTESEAPVLLKARVDYLYTQLKPIENRKVRLWLVFLVSLALAVRTFVNSAGKFETLRAVGEIGYGVIILAPIVTGIWLAADYLKKRKTYDEIFAIWEKLESAGFCYIPACGDGSLSKLIPRKQNCE